NSSVSRLAGSMRLQVNRKLPPAVELEQNLTGLLARALSCISYTSNGNHCRLYPALCKMLVGSVHCRARTQLSKTLFPVFLLMLPCLIGLYFGNKTIGLSYIRKDVLGRMDTLKPPSGLRKWHRMQARSASNSLN